MGDSCFFCKRETNFNNFIWISNLQKLKPTCLECSLSSFCQEDKWEDADIEFYLNWIERQELFDE